MSKTFAEKEFFYRKVPKAGKTNRAQLLSLKKPVSNQKWVVKRNIKAAHFKVISTPTGATLPKTSPATL